ncbi:MAG: hypothetical protein FWE50_03205 [Alphaproteobacteria bacterium]|nr:hypothetical protein [Alphaproteobacteria bacterium]
MNLNAEFFFDLERQLKAAGLDSDFESFDVIKARLANKEPLSADEFARQAFYVILAGGFSQKAAKKIHAKVMDYIANNVNPQFDDLIKIFDNKNKMNAILKIWQNRKAYRDGYYQLSDLVSKLTYLSSLPHIGKITANHLARNLGEDIVKYDIWIQRLGVAFAGNDELKSKIDNGNLNPEVQAACDAMFAHLVTETGLPRGYIDVVLWKACQNHMIEGV